MVEEPFVNSCPDCVDKCFAKNLNIVPVRVKEEKFISESDVVSSLITSDQPVQLEISGQSYGNDDNIVSVNGKCSVDIASNSIHVEESGVILTKVFKDVIKNGSLMYEGMSGVLTASQPLEDVTIFDVSPGVCGYNFTVPLDKNGLTLSWTMNDDWSQALDSVSQIQADPVLFMSRKTQKMNYLLNDLIPYFRCSDEDIVKIYYYLWSIYLMYYTKGDRGMQMQPHTQTAVKNFLGMHRYDAVFQIPVGSWISPEHHAYYANGNVLVWKDVLPYRDGPNLPDNFGIDWVSGVYGPSFIAHVIGAWEIFEHSGNMTYLSEAYNLYKELLWDKIGGKHWMLAYDSVLSLNKMADVLGYFEDAIHWNSSINMENYYESVENQWEEDTPNLFGRGADRVGFSNVAPAGVTLFPREYIDRMAREWLDNSIDGFNNKIPLTTIAQQDWPYADIITNFAYVPDSNWYMIRGLYMHTIDHLANKFLLGHLKKYHLEWGNIVVSSERRRLDSSVSGDLYSNFNAGKIDLILKGLGGLKYSVIEDSFTFADNLPTEWSFMEFHVPVQNGSNITWVKARAERKEDGETIIKSVNVESNPFAKLIIQPWLEDSEVESFIPPNEEFDSPIGHKKWIFEAENANVTLTLKPIN